MSSGLSGLTRAPSGRLWAVEERGNGLLEIDAAGRILRRLSMPSPTHARDLESIAATGEHRFSLGVEVGAFTGAKDEKLAAKIIEIEIDGDTVSIVGEIAIPYALWNVEAEENLGIEGLCHVSGATIASLELATIRDGRRYAPLAVRTDTWKAFWLELTSEEGKIAALDCIANGDDIDLYAIERHFGIARVVKYRLSLEDGPGKPTILANLDAFVTETGINAEGIVADSATHIWLIVDNHWKTITGPNELLELSLAR